MSSPPSPARPAPRLNADLIGGRLFAWAGGVAIVVGIALFFLMAVSRGWLDHAARIAFGAAASLALLGAGVWLHGRRGRTEASLVAIGTAIVGLFTTLAVGAGIYHVLAPIPAIGAALAVGALATGLAVRWAATPIAWLGLIGALLSPILVGSGETTVTVALLLVAASAAMATAVWRRWPWLAVAAAAVCVPQWGRWAAQDHPLVLSILVLGAFAVLGLLTALASCEPRDEHGHAPNLILIALNALALGAVGWIALAIDHSTIGAALWLAGLGALHLIAAAVVRTPSARPATPSRRPLVPLPVHGLSLTVGVILGDIAFGLGTGGIVLVIGWGASAVGFALLRRRALRAGGHPDLLLAGLGAQLALALMRAIVDAPPGHLGSAAMHGPDGAIAVAVLAVACLVCGQLTDDESGFGVAAVINAIAVLALVYLPVVSLSGASLAAAWAAEGGALAGAARTATLRQRRPTQLAGLMLLSLAAAHVTVIEAPPSSLVLGAPSLPGAAAGLAALTLGLIGAARGTTPATRERMLLAGAAAGTGLYLLSVAIISVFQPAQALASIIDFGGTLVGERQQGQVLLSVCWSMIGLGGVIAGLRRHQAAVRNAGLGLLLLAMVKVFLYDLSSLDSIYRVSSFVALGVLLLATAFAYQRLRPPPAPDLRSVPRSLR